MSGYVKTTFICGILATFFWFACIVAEPANFELFYALVAVAFSIVFLCFLAVSISRRMKKSISPYKVFAVVDGLVGLCVAAYAIYDIMTDTGWFAGLLGVLLLLLVVPITIVLLLADLLVWKMRKSKRDET